MSKKTDDIKCAYKLAKYIEHRLPCSSRNVIDIMANEFLFLSKKGKLVI